MKARTLGSVIALACGLLALDVLDPLSPFATAQAGAHRAPSRPTRSANVRVSRPHASTGANRTVQRNSIRQVPKSTGASRLANTGGTPRFSKSTKPFRPAAQSGGHTFKPAVTTFKPPAPKVIGNQGGPAVSTGTLRQGTATLPPKALKPVGTTTAGISKVPLTPRQSPPTPGTGANPQTKGGLGKGPGKAFAADPRRFPTIRLTTGAFPFVAGRKRIFRDGRWHVFVPFATLGIVAVGGAYFYPSAYVSTGRRVCTGLTPEGCQLNWQLIGFEGGSGNAFQCVSYCPRPGQAPPPPTASLVALTPPPPSAAPGRCELTIFAEPDFGGANSVATGDEPTLSESGWKNEIASVQIKSGTWDFFTDDGFGGESMRLHAGPQPQLGAEWSKHIGSFQCIQGS